MAWGDWQGLCIMWGTGVEAGEVGEWGERTGGGAGLIYLRPVLGLLGLWGEQSGFYTALDITRALKWA